jgi:transcriptional regulator with XRE-family HTH domain
MSLTDGQIDAMIGERVKAARVVAGLTQAQLAEQVGLSRSSIANLERGQQSIPAYTLVRLAEVLSVPIVTLADLGTLRSEDADFEPASRAELAAVHLRIWRLEDYAKRLAGLLGAAGGVLDAAKLLEREVLNPPSVVGR